MHGPIFAPASQFRGASSDRSARLAQNFHPPAQGRLRTTTGDDAGACVFVFPDRAVARMEMDFLGPRSAPRHAMPLVARRDAEDDGEPWRLASPAHFAYPDVRAAAAHRHHPTAPSYQLHAPPPPPLHPQAFPCAIPASSLQGPQVVHRAAYSPDRRCSAAQLTIFYAGSVHVFDNVTKEKAEQITFMAAKASQAGRSPPLRRALRQSESAPVPEERKQMPLARACSDPVHPSPQALFMLPHRDVPLARSASLARFLERRKRKQRTANAATPYSRREISPGSVDTFRMVSPGSTTLSGNTELSWFFGDEKLGSRDEEALDTELKM
ncbi:hypothetical protein ACQJBY_055446 [Aegilops geniculata]